MVERNTFQTEDTWAKHPELRRNRLEKFGKLQEIQDTWKEPETL